MSRVFESFHTTPRIFVILGAYTTILSSASRAVKTLVLAALLSSMVSACAIEGDFGRPRPTIFDRVADEWLASPATLLGSRGGSGVTDDEAAMREAGHRLASPLNPPPPASSIPYGTPYGGYGGFKGPYDPAGPLAAIGESLAADHETLTLFGQAARRVLITDSRRMQAVYEHDPYLLEEDRRSARERMRENFAFIERVFEDFGRRLEAYHYAIEDIRANAPIALVTEVQGSLHHLRDRTASLEYELTHYFGTAVARGDFQPPRFASRQRGPLELGPRYGNGYDRNPAIPGAPGPGHGFK